MTVLEGDCRVVMATLDAESIDAIVTDPPYELRFMGRGWDGTGVAYDPETWKQALRVAKPGAFLLAFGGTRTFHRMVVAIEDAGWEIRDCLVWAYASGFPKGGDLGRAMDAKAGVERPQRLVATRTGNSERRGQGEQGATYGDAHGGFTDTSEPVTPDAQKWTGWSTTLKPAWEPIVMARKPFRTSVAENVLKHGTGALNIDATRIPVDPNDPVKDAVWTSRPSAFRDGTQGFVTSQAEGDRNSSAETAEKGRWPANVILTDPIFDGDLDGVVGGGEVSPPKPERVGLRGGSAWHGMESFGSPDQEGRWPADLGGTHSRFFLIPKASRSDREPVIPGTLREANPFDRDGPSRNFERMGSRSGPRENTHSTVKPTELMRHLVRLVTPAGGTVLDPFGGSGTTALACEAEGFPWLLIELDPESVAIARARLPGTQRGLGI
jgi:site-specific DNA-methyltransferase (adenine-specific)